MKKKVYVIANSHMDPIWIWRLREGRSAWLNTCRTTVKMLKKYPFLKFSRSSSVCYRWIEESDPALFREIRKLADAGRWEPVGGWVEQSDVIITPGESLIRQAEHGKRYFREKFGLDVRIAYCVDSFGQNIGLPKILKETGFDSYVWMRPMQHEKAMPHLFRWKCDDNAGDILCLRIRNAYCTPNSLADFDRFSDWFKQSIGDEERAPNFFFGVGDHGGGICERQLQYLLKLGEEYDLEFSTLGDYFKVLEKLDLPAVGGEHTHHAPGCYSAVGGVKQWMADAEKNLYKAEKIVLQGDFRDRKSSLAKLDAAWEELLFNYFHDVYPGTCSRASYEHEIRDLCGMVNKTAADIIEQSLSRVGSTIRTDFLTEGGVLLWNPLPQPTVGAAALDTYCDPNVVGSDFNCLRDAEGRELPLQWIRAATSYGPGANWGRGVFTAELGASEARAFAYGRTEKKFPSVGFDRQKALLKRLRFDALRDLNDTWAHSARALGETLGHPELLGVEEQENGPVVSRLRTTWRWKSSEFKLDLFAWNGIPEIEAHFSGLWLELKETLKLALQTGDRSGRIVSGQASAHIVRQADEREQPFLDYVAAGGSGFFANALHSYDSIGGETLRLTVLRPVLYAEHEPNPPHGDEGAADIGPQERKFWIFTGAETSIPAVEAAARRRLWSCEHFEITAASDGRRFRWDAWEVQPEFLTVSAQRLLPDGTAEFHLLNPSDEPVAARIRCNGRTVKQCRMAPAQLKLVKVAL